MADDSFLFQKGWCMASFPVIISPWAILLPGRAVISPGLGNGTTGTCPGHTHWLTHPAGLSAGPEGSNVAKHQPSLLESLYLWLPGRFWPWLHELQCCLVSLKLTLSSALAHLDRIRHSGWKRTQQLKLAHRGLSRLQKKHVAFQTSCSPKQNQQF